MENKTQDIFFHCKKCGAILNEADFEFDRNKTSTCANCAVGRGNFSAYIENRRKKSGRFYLFTVFRWLFPYFLWGELFYRMFLSHTFFFQGLLSVFSSTGGWIGLSFDIALMLSGVAAVICAFLFLGVGLTPDADETYAYSSVDINGRAWTHIDTTEHPILNFFVFLWNVLKIIFVCFITFLGIIILMITVIVHCVKGKRSNMKLSRYEKSQCARYKKILKLKSKKCKKYTIYSNAEMQRRKDNYQSVSLKETISVEGEKYFVCGSKNINCISSSDTIYMLARPCNNHVEHKFLLRTAIRYFDIVNLLIPFKKENITNNQSDYFPISAQTIMYSKNLLAKHYGKAKKM